MSCVSNGFISQRQDLLRMETIPLYFFKNISFFPFPNLIPFLRPTIKSHTKKISYNFRFFGKKFIFIILFFKNLRFFWFCRVARHLIGPGHQPNYLSWNMTRNLVFQLGCGPAFQSLRRLIFQLSVCLGPPKYHLPWDRLKFWLFFGESLKNKNLPFKYSGFFIKIGFWSGTLFISDFY